ncbi:hypothetical protein [Exiguobacterium sp. s22]|uniref:hypothetical protein n=1 Tax=Exiguobacterium sp. s22 TaxID=2751272 RepID=UPI001BEB38F7|nr:hypothetical protein [Exiguobacterium sp. s22]
MRFTTRLLIIMLVSLMLITGFIHLARLFWEWFHDPTEGGIILRFSGEDGVSGDAFDGKSRFWKGDDLQFLKNDFLDYTFGTDGTVTESGNSYWLWFLIGGVIVLLILTLMMMQKRKRVISTIDFSSDGVKRKNRTMKTNVFVDPTEIKWTDNAIRNALIQFNAELPVSHKHRSNETVLDWFARIGIHAIDLSPYWQSRYKGEVVSDEDVRRFREGLYLKRVEE